MSLCPRQGLVPLLLLSWLCWPVAAHAGGGVKDAAALFKGATVRKADDAIEEIRRRTHKDLLIETVNKLPADKLKEYRTLQDGAQRAAFFDKLAQEQARRAEVDGVYVLLCRVPADEEPRRGLASFIPHGITAAPPLVVGHTVIVWPETEANDRYFPKEDRDQLDALFGDIKAEGHNQEAQLLKAVDFAGKTLEANARALGAPPPDTFRWTAALWAAGVLVGAWAALGALRGRLAARQGTPGPAPGGGQGPTALLGATGGLWLYERYFAGQPEEPPLAPEPVAAAPAPAPGAEGHPELPIHPDDLEAMTREAAVWSPEGAEAPTGHDQP
jgi:hypothetical protein